MAFGIHWEWRGFGVVSESFIERYGRLDHAFGPQKVEDLYIWAPRLGANLKIRAGESGGLKFKRLLEKDGRLDCAVEDPAELLPFPLQEPAWHMLAAELSQAGIDIGPFPGQAPGSEKFAALLERAGCKLVLVPKERGARWWQGPNGRVLVERTAIHKPQPILSIGLESEDTGDGVTNEQAKADLQAAIAALKLDQEPLRVMNYLDIVALWARGETVNF